MKFLILATAVTVLSVLMLYCSGQSPTTQSNREERVVNSIKGVHYVRHLTNGRKIQQEQIAALKETTAESLKAPVLVSSFYIPVPSEVHPRSYTAVIAWIQDQPTLKSVLVSNPETRKEEVVEISAKTLDYAAQYVAPRGILYGETVWILIELAGEDQTQCLEVMTLDRKQRATLYPSLPKKQTK